jgi:MFS family permease
MINPIHRHYTAAFCLDLAFMMGFTALPFYVFKELGGGAAMSGVIGGGLSLSYAFVCIVGGRLVTKASNSLHVASLGALGLSLFFFLASFSRDPIVFALLSMCGMGSMAFAWPTLHAWLGGEPDLRKRGRYMARFNISWSAGMALGSLLSGFLFEIHSRLPYICVCVFGGISAILIFLQPQEHSYFRDVPAHARDEHQNHTRLSEFYLLPTWVACVTGWCLLGAARTVYPKRLDALVAENQLTLFLDPLPPEWPVGAAALFSVLAFAITFASATVFVLMGRSVAWHHTFRFIIALELMACAASWLLAATHSLALMVLCYTVVGVSVYAAFFAAIFYSVANPARKHRRASMNEALVGIGAFTGSAVFGWAAQEWSVSAPFKYAPLFILASIAVQIALLRRTLAADPSPTGSRVRSPSQ